VKKILAPMILTLSLGSILGGCALVPGSGQSSSDQSFPSSPQVERLSADALFPFGRGDVSDIRPAGLRDISQIAAQLRGSPFGHVDVVGYTDRLGSDSSNLALSQRRANAVREVFIQQGVPAGKIRAKGLGSQDPVVQCDNVTADALVRCLQPNRRVEIVTYVRDDPRWRQ
jgi:OOP family OmpA-OmpF porin